MSRPRGPNFHRNTQRNCSHKAQIGCVLTTTAACCACCDRRPEAPAYPVYVDGEGVVLRGTRWARYCSECKNHWTTSSHQQSSTDSVPSLRPATYPTHPLNRALSHEENHPQENQTQRISRLRTELEGVRTGIQRVVSDLHEIEDREGLEHSQDHGMSSNMSPTTPQTTGPDPLLRWSPPQSATSPSRYFNQQRGQRRGQRGPTRRTGPADLAARQRAFLRSAEQQQQQQQQNNQMAQAERARIVQSYNSNGRQAQSPPQQHQQQLSESQFAGLGTREEVEDPDYVSPVGAMFGRAWDRYRQNAEVGGRAAHAGNAQGTPGEQARNAELPAISPNTTVPHGHLASILTDVSQTPFQFGNSSRGPPAHPNHLLQGSNYNLQERQYYESIMNQQMHQSQIFGYALPGPPDHMMHHGPHPPLTDPAPFLSSMSNHRRRAAHLRAEEAAYMADREHRGLHPDYTAWGHGSPYPGHHGYDDDSDSEVEEKLTFDTQERPPPLVDADAMKLDMSCKICMHQIIDTVLLPCMHAVMCRWCAELEVPGRSSMPHIPKDRGAKCPKCRKAIKEKRKIFIS